MKANNQITSKRRLARKWALVAGFLLASLAPKESRGESETVSREVSVFNFGRSSADVEAISREVSVFNFGQPSAAIEAISREVTVFNFGRPSAEVEAISREVSVLNIEGLTNQPPVIFVQPQSQSVAFGNPVTFTVTAGGTAPLSYQWFFNATNAIAGGTSAALTLTNLQSANAGDYRVVVSNAFGVVTSVVAVLNVQLWLCGGGPGPVSGGGVDRFYEDGYVRVDSSGNSGGLTWFWGYVDARQVPGDGFIYFHCQGVSNSTPITLTDRYALNGVMLPSPPFDGTFSGPGTPISDSPVRSVTLNACSLPRPGLIAWWPGDDNANDLSGTNSGALINGATFGEGRIGNAFHLDGINDYVSVPDSPIWDLFANDFSIQLWAKLDRIKESMFIHRQAGSDSGGWEFDFQPALGSLVFARNPFDIVIQRPWSPETNIWYHLAVTRGSGVYRLYLNGVQMGVDQLDPNSDTNVIVQPPGMNFVAWEAESPKLRITPGTPTSFVITNDPTPSGSTALFTSSSGGQGIAYPRGFASYSIKFRTAGLYRFFYRWRANPAYGQIDINSANSFWMPNRFNATTVASPDANTNYVVSSGNNVVAYPASGTYNLLSDNQLLAVTQAQVDAGEALVFTIGTREAGMTFDRFVLALESTLTEAQFNALSNSDADASGPLRIGDWANQAADYRVAGSLDELAIFNRALSSSEIAAIYATGSAGMCKPPSISEQTASLFVPVGTNVLLSVTASGTEPLSYQWYFNGIPIGGASSSSLSLLNVDGARTGAYRVVVSNAFGVVLSDVATLTVNEPLLLTQQPQSQTVFTGQSVAFTVNATGSLPLGFFWYRSGVPFTNEVLNQHSSTIALANVQTFDSANFQVIVTNAVLPTGVASVFATLTVVAPVAVSAQPTNVTAAVGGSATFCVGATGSAPIRYQWRHNGANVPGATNACLTLTNVTLAEGGAYQVVLENAAGTLASDTALLVIAVPAGPAPDYFTNRFTLTGASGSIGVTNVGATKEPGEPNHAGKPGGASVWYRWVAPSNGIATFRTLGSTFDTLLAVDTGTNLALLTPVASDEDDGGFFTSLVAFNAVAGTDYAIAVDGFGGAEGNFILSWSLEITAQVLPVITAQPASHTVLPGANTTLNVGATGSGLRYQWHFLGGALPNQTNSILNLPSVQATNVGSYLVAVTNNQGRGLHSEVAVVETGPVPTVQSQDKFEDLFLDGSGGSGFAPASTGGGFISVSVGTTTVPQTINNTESSTQSGEADHCVVISTATRWLRYRTEQAGVLVIDTLGSAIPTVVEVYSALNVLGLPTGSVACGKTNATDGRSSVVSFTAVAGKEYYVAADGFRGAVGIIRLNASLGQVPALPVANPTNAVVDAGEGIQLNAPEPLNGTSGLRYQWRLNGRDIEGATGDTYQLSAADPANGGTYTVVIYNDYGQAIYTVGAVTVQVNYLQVEPQLINGRLRLWVQRPADGAVVIEASDALGLWTPLHTVPLTAPGPAIDVPVSPTGPRFFRGKPWP